MAMTISRAEIENILHENFKITHLEITDDSAKHRGHAGVRQSGGGHFDVFIVSDDFIGKSLIQRHKMIYSALKEKLGSQIHALALRTMTAKERMKYL